MQLAVEFRHLCSTSNQGRLVNSRQIARAAVAVLWARCLDELHIPKACFPAFTDAAPGTSSLIALDQGNIPATRACWIYFPRFTG
jgi:hypothetical protein